MAPLQRHQSHVQIRWQHTRRHKCDSADKMTAKKLHRLHVRKGLIAASMERELFTPPLQGQGASAFRGDCDCEQQEWRQRTKTRACFHHSDFRIASSHSVKSRDIILFIAFSHDGGVENVYREASFPCDFSLGSAGMSSRHGNKKYRGTHALGT